MTIYGFWHVASIGPWREIVASQLAKLIESGLYDATQMIFVNVVGASARPPLPDGLRTEKVAVSWDGNVQRFEYPTLQILQQRAREEEFCCWYIHVKGVSSAVGAVEANVRCWREYMEYFTIEKWRVCRDYLADHDTAGVEWSLAPQPHYSGNFWWARSDYLRRLPPVDEVERAARGERVPAEFWIGSGSPRAKCLYRFGRDLYRFAAKCEEYCDRADLRAADAEGRGSWRSEAEGRKPGVGGQQPEVSKMADKLFLGIPILNRADLLADCLARIDHPAEILIINNDSISREFRRQLQDLACRHGAEVRNQQRNLGVAASWNRIIQWGMGLGYRRIVIGSNDTLLDPGSLARLESLPPPEEDEVGIWHLCGWNFFAINAWAISKVGLFDENFYPAYKEDDDYGYRCRLAGVPHRDLPGASGTHLLSQTIASDADYARLNQETQFHWNHHYYIAKWGGELGSERFATPYDKPDRDHRWWPDPCDKIEARDWDRGRRARAARQFPARATKGTVPFLLAQKSGQSPNIDAIEREFERAKQAGGDIHEHMDTLRRLAEECGSVVEAGVRHVVSTWAFLLGCSCRGGVVNSYCLKRLPEIARAERLCRAAAVPWRFHEGDWLRERVTIPETDLLFIDTRHDYSQLRDELARHGDRARKYIVLHDTTTFGDVGEDGSRPGLWQAVEEWVARGAWRVKQRHANCNGLTILARA